MIKLPFIPIVNTYKKVIFWAMAAFEIQSKFNIITDLKVI